MDQMALGGRKFIPWTSYFLTFVVASGMIAGLDLWLGGLDPTLDEPLGLRWLRAVVAHPVRSPLALTLFCIALRGAGRRS
jgi:hypothetical protein